jgi:shikimate dehydrogenase
VKQFGIIGYPLAHSFSQKYFTQKFLDENLNDCTYQMFPIQTIDELKNVLQNNPDLKGLNVTIPHKKAVVNLLTDTTNLPLSLQACNCIKINDGKLIGFNTDAIGFENSLIPLLKPHHTKALVLGNGGAATAVKYVLNKLKIEYKVVSRNLHNDSNFTYEDIDETILNQYSIIINTTPLGTFPNVDECATIPYQYLTNQHLLYDLVYNPDKTLFLQKGEQQGATIKNGYEMLIIQAEENWRIWNGD